MAKKGISIKQLAKNLDIAEGYLKSISKGVKNGQEFDFLGLNAANACRAMAARTGYQSEQAARKAIEKDVYLLFQDPSKLIRIFQNLGTRDDELGILAKQGAKFLISGNWKKFNSIIAKHPTLQGFKIKGLSAPDGKMIDELQSSAKPNKATARAILTKYGANGYRIMCKKSAIEKEIEKRVKRWGNTSSMWWNAAKQLNPKIKKGNLDLPKNKSKNLKNPKGTISIQRGNGVEAIVTHYAERLNPKFKQKLESHIARESAFWGEKAANQIAASDYFKKLLEQ